MLKQALNQDGENLLPSDGWQTIFSHLGYGDLNSVSLSCKDFLTDSNALRKSLKVINPNISMLSQHLKRFSRLKMIDLLDFDGDINEAIREIERSGVSLEALHLLVTEDLFEPSVGSSLRELGSNLKALKCFVPGDQLRDSDLVAITDTFPNLEELGIYHYCKKIIPTVSGFETLASNLKLLKKIRVFSCNVSDESLIALSLNCVLLRHVAIVGLNCITEIGVGHLLRNRPNLEALNFQLQFNPLSQSSLITIENSIRHAKALTSLVVCNKPNTDRLLMAIAKAKLRLKKLVLIDCRDLSGSGLLAVLSHHLTHLGIVRANIGDVDMEILLNGDVGKLRVIDLCKSKVTNSTLFLLSTKCPLLIYIRLSQCSEVTSTGIEAVLKGCKLITYLRLSEYNKAKITDEADDSELPQLNLEVLELSSSKIDDEGLAAIAKKCPRLLSLDLQSCKDVTTEGIKQVLENIKSLTCLNLTKCGDRQNYGALLEWMLSTGNLASLKKIILRNEDFSEEHRDQFSQRGCLLVEECFWKRMAKS